VNASAMGTRLPGPSVELVEHDDVPVRFGCEVEPLCEPCDQPG
jgi:hypothetical protein